VSRKTMGRKQEDKARLVRFRFNESTYEIDPDRHKVYRRFVEIETSRAAAIYSVWRSRNIQV
jgi:hypothetical protein